jgi:ribosomal protein S18 acetylase RimI-like enzyme
MMRGSDISAGFAGVRDNERQRALDTLVLAFVADPLIRWLYPEARQYLAHFCKFAEAFAGTAFAENTAWRLDHFSAVALWLPPDDPSDDAWMAKLDSSVSPEKMADFRIAGTDQTDDRTARHWYLALIGVDPARQRQGLGTELMSRCLEVIDEDHLPACLDTANAREIPFYKRHGFNVTGKSQAGRCPPIYSMMRDAH